MDFGLTFAVLLYFNAFYFGFYAVLTAIISVLKATVGERAYLYTGSVLWTETLVFLFMVATEAGRLYLAHSHEKVRDWRIFMQMFLNESDCSSYVLLFL